MGSTDEEIRVLHIDDEPGLADLAATFLEREDERFVVKSVTDPGTGLDRLVEGEFDCVISDYDMPGRNGIEFLKAVRERYPDLPFILYTGKGSEEVASEAISAGVTDYLQKESGTDHYKLLANRVMNAVVQSRAQQQAMVVEQQLQDLSEVSNDVLWMFTHDWKELLYINPTYEDIWGRSTETLAEDPLDLLNGVHPDDRDAVRTAMEQLSNGTSIDIESRVNADEEYQRWVWVQGFPLTDETGTVTRIAGFVRDITDRKQRTQELELKTRAMDEAPVGITISDPSQEDNPIIYANEGFTQVTGYPTPELIGRNCRFLQGGETDPERVAEMRRTINAEEPVTVELQNYRKGGEKFWNRITIAPVKDEAGELKNFVGFQEDVTDRKEQQQERETLVESLQGLYDIATNTEVEPDDKITQLLGLGPRKLDLPYSFLTRIETGELDQGQGVQRVVEASGNHDLLQPRSSCPLSESYCRKTIQAGGILEIQDAVEAGWEDDPAYERFDLGSYIGTSVTVGDDIYGTVFFASTHPREEPFSEAERTFVQLASQLVSYELERKVVTSELTHRNRRLEEFTRIVSHDLEGPLTAAQRTIELAAEECDSSYLETAGDAVERSQAQIDELVALAREGDQANDSEAVDLETILEHCWQNVHTGTATLVTATDSSIRANPNRLEQLVENLLGNAVAHGGEDVTITVGDLAGGFYIEDDGHGIPEEDRSGIFEVGYSTAPDGTGFGLSVVTQIVDDHGWEIEVTESSTGGARFEITDVEFVEA
ncbi:PAS domain-containing protein [Halobaculum rarum]|uniref:PAS domain-containing protein n=1 Tax=Halobaculum rarum TaxID=3075122 RepID=UPI0032AEF617